MAEKTLRAGFHAEPTPNSIGWVNVLLLVQYNMPNNH